jgi:hypothetical protein
LADELDRTPVDRGPQVRPMISMAMKPRINDAMPVVPK